jgi:hypothetical protein
MACSRENFTLLLLKSWLVVLHHPYSPDLAAILFSKNETAARFGYVPETWFQKVGFNGAYSSGRKAGPVE